MRKIIPYLFRASVAFYFIYPAILNLRDGASFVNSPLFKCFTSAYAFAPDMVSTIVNILFIILGLLILLWKHPLTPLVLGILVLISEFILTKDYSFDFLMVIVPITLVNVGLAIFYSRHSDNW